MCLLCSFAGGVELAGLHVLLAHLFLDDIPTGAEGQLREIYTISSHIGDESALVEVLGNQHRLGHGESEFMSGLLLQGAGGEGGSWRTMNGSRLDIINRERGLLY